MSKDERCATGIRDYEKYRANYFICNTCKCKIIVYNDCNCNNINWTMK